MKIFLAGASGVIGRRLVPLLVAAGHAVVGATRDKAAAVAALGAEPVVVDVFDVATLRRAVQAAAPQRYPSVDRSAGSPRYARL